MSAGSHAGMRTESLPTRLFCLVTRQGRVFFVDEHPDGRGKEACAAGSDEILELGG